MPFQSKVLGVSLAAVLSAVQGVRTRRDMSKGQIADIKVHESRTNAEDYILLFREGTSEATIRDVCKGQCALEGHPDNGGVAFAEVRGRKDLMEVISRHHGEIQLLEAVVMDNPIPDIEEPESGAPRTATSASWGLDRVGVPERASTGRGVHIYVQDTGVRGSHRDFGGRVIPTIDLSSGSLVECANVGSTKCSGDVHGHGTHCAGSAAGDTFGVANGATIHAVKTLSDEGPGSRSWQMAAIDWVTVSGSRPAVISMSLGGSGRDPSYTASIGAATVAGVTVVVAAGNNNRDACNFSPAFAADAITVGATTPNDARASYSNYGTCNNIMAPGSSIKSASSRDDKGSRTLSGTSMACPHVSGAAALLLELNPSLNRHQILKALQQKAKTGVIRGLKAGDPDEFLWVGA